MSNPRMLPFALLALGLVASPAAFAEEAPTAEEATAESNDEATEETPANSEEKGDTAENGDDDKKDEDDKKESKDGSYEWKLSWGGGVEAGYFFSDLDRLDSNVLTATPNADTPFDTAGIGHLDLALEASFLENTRLGIFGGMQSTLSSDTSATAYYFGVEPAFAFRRNMWEVALGAGFGFGSLSIETAESNTMDASLLVLRPFFEVRRYLNEWSGVYGRIGFNEWKITDPELDGLVIARGSSDMPLSSNNLNEGGAYLALGLRFGSYPEPILHVPDTDQDTYLDDVDECPNEPEDFDQFQDEDGCPDTDNDQDGIVDADDTCPEVAEDINGYQDTDGCPDANNDTDKDGIMDPADKCPDKPEDIDGWEDEDGCPEDTDDADGDGIPDISDKCPNEAGVPMRQGCPFLNVKVTAKAIVITDKVFFELAKADIKPESFGLLDNVAETLKSFPRVKLVEVQGHTDHKGKADKNLALSQARAESVKAYLVSKGVEEARLVAKGYGMTAPLVPLPENGKETAEGAEQNRRVEFVILEQDRPVQIIREDKLKNGMVPDKVIVPTKPSL